MFIITTDSEKLAASIQRDYQKAAEDHRLLAESDTNGAGLSTLLKVGLALASIVGLLAAVSQFTIA